MILIEDYSHKTFNFPCGEMHVRIASTEASQLNSAPTIYFNFERNDEIIELLFVVDALKRMGIPPRQLIMPYIPFARQDRVAVNGECFSLKVFADLINGLGFDEVLVTDPHSDVATALINNCEVIKQWEVFNDFLLNQTDYWLISPDSGALKKTYELASKVASLGVIECSKKRNVQTGEITGVVAHIDDLRRKDCYIVDDIADKGGTFIGIAKELKKKNCGKIVLMVSHGFFNAGFTPFDGLIDEIYSRNGKLK